MSMMGFTELTVPEANLVGMGVVARDHEGQVIAVASKKISGSFEALEVEAMATRFATGFAKDLGFRSMIFEGDNLEVINALTSHDALFIAVGLVIEDAYYEAKSSFDMFHFSHIG
ncbi:hypothetical protein L1049_001698 [Liquidambar formosana]|uniref:RNase H type-1 domain-containing protein n=1 Tax=Liquidambar formosana TaxID=63359 RepID=A0AAP0N6N6_LIQFO